MTIVAIRWILELDTRFGREEGGPVSCKRANAKRMRRKALLRDGGKTRLASRDTMVCGQRALRRQSLTEIGNDGVYCSRHACGLLRHRPIRHKVAGRDCLSRKMNLEVGRKEKKAPLKANTQDKRKEARKVQHEGRMCRRTV